MPAFRYSLSNVPRRWKIQSPQTCPSRHIAFSCSWQEQPLHFAHHQGFSASISNITMKLGAYLEYNNGEYECTLCERYFCHEAAFYEYCRWISRYAWCERCAWVFVSASAKDTYHQESNTYYICSICPQLPDFEDGEELKDHRVDFHHYCPDCGIYCNSKKQLQRAWCWETSSLC